MRCPNCNVKKANCVDSRPSPDRTMRRRRYKCSRGHTFSTYETYITAEVWQNQSKMQQMTDLLQPLLDMIKKPKKLENKRERA